jgi:hypothetical protein
MTALDWTSFPHVPPARLTDDEQAFLDADEE